MRLTPTKIARLGLISIALSCNCFASEEEQVTLSEAEQLTIIRSWLPSHASIPQLIFEYRAAESSEDPKTALDMHKAIDRAGPTIVVLEARSVYENEYKLIGGYNPYKWKNFWGQYERSPGKFVFNLQKRSKWDRAASRAGFQKHKNSHGLQFGEGDIVIHPDLKTGTASNKTFSQTLGSVLLGQSGPFEIGSIRIYKLKKDHAAQSAPLPLPWKQSHKHPSSPVGVPDNGNPAAEIGLALGALLIIRRIWEATK